MVGQMNHDQKKNWNMGIKINSSGYILLLINVTDNQCLTSCPRGYTSDPIRNECVACPAHCLRCSAPGSCDQCDGQSFMVQNPDPLRESMFILF